MTLIVKGENEMIGLKVTEGITQGQGFLNIFEIPSQRVTPHFTKRA
jgi:hypothetical protein